MPIVTPSLPAAPAVPTIPIRAITKPATTSPKLRFITILPEWPMLSRVARRGPAESSHEMAGGELVGRHRAQCRRLDAAARFDARAALGEGAALRRRDRVRRGRDPAAMA